VSHVHANYSCEIFFAFLENEILSDAYLGHAIDFEFEGGIEGPEEGNGDLEQFRFDVYLLASDETVGIVVSLSLACDFGVAFDSLGNFDCAERVSVVLVEGVLGEGEGKENVPLFLFEMFGHAVEGEEDIGLEVRAFDFEGDLGVGLGGCGPAGGLCKGYSKHKQ
jgi:hypothetical protein